MIYLQIGVALCIIMCIVGYIKEKHNPINPLTGFCGIWALVLIFSGLQYYTMKLASDDTYLLIFVGLIFYCIGYIVEPSIHHIKFTFGSNRYGNNVGSAMRYVPRYRLLYALSIIGIAFSVLNLISVVRQVGLFSLGSVQTLLQSDEYVSDSSRIRSALSLLIVNPVTFALPAITASDFWFGKRDRKLIVLTVIMLFIRMLSSANRTSLLLFFVYLGICGLFYIARLKGGSFSGIINAGSKRRKTVRMLILFGIIGVFAFVLMTMSRGAKVFKNVYLDFAIPPRMLEIWNDSVKDQNVTGYGVASLCGFIYPIFYLIKNLFGIPMPDHIQYIYDWTMLTDTQWVWPGTNIKANAYVSAFWFLYVDARMFGVIVGMLILGFIMGRSFHNIKRNCYSARDLALYCLLMYGVLFSFVRLQFTLSKFALGVLFIIFFAYKKKREAC